MNTTDKMFNHMAKAYVDYRNAANSHTRRERDAYLMGCVEMYCIACGGDGEPLSEEGVYQMLSSHYAAGHLK